MSRTLFAPGSAVEEGRSRFGRELLLAALLLLVWTAIVFGSPAGLGLYHDDWFHLHDVALGDEEAWDATSPRPLHLAPWKALGAAFGSWLPGYYLALFGLQGLTAVMIYGLVRLWFPFTPALLVAALFVSWPADASEYWLSTLPARASLFLVIGAILSVEVWRFRRVGRTPLSLCLAATALAGFALFLYELPLGLVVVWPAVAAVAGRAWSSRSIVLWEAVPALYLAWRFLGRTLLGLPFQASASFLFDPRSILWRTGISLYNLFVEGWKIVLVESAPSLWETTGLLGVTMLAAMAAGRLQPGGQTSMARWRTLVAGGLLVAAGLAPIVPTDHWLGRNAGTFAARLFIGAIPGVAVLGAAALGLATRNRWLRIAGAACLLTGGALFHWDVRRDALVNSHTQRQVAREIRGWTQALNEGEFLVVLDLPASRIAYDMPFGFGRLLALASGQPISGIGISSDRRPAELLALEENELLVHRGRFGRVPLERVVWLCYEDGRLRHCAAPVTVSATPRPPRATSANRRAGRGPLRDPGRSPADRR